MRLKDQPPTAYKILIMAVLLVGACFLTYYFHFSLKAGNVFSHIYYIPIILAALWWQFRGLAVPLFLGLLLIVSHYLSQTGTPDYYLREDFSRVVMFVGIGAFVALLSEQIASTRKRLFHINRTLRSMNKISLLVSQESHPEPLIQGICELLVENADYPYAWIAILNEAGEVTASAAAGRGPVFPSLAEKLGPKKIPECGRKALVENNVVIIDDPASACAGCPFSGQSGEHSSMTTRLESGARIYGLLGLSVPARFAGKKAEESLFLELAGGILSALKHLKLEETRRKTEEKLRDSERYANSLVQNAQNPIMVAGPDTTINYVNPAFVELTGFPAAELLGKKVPYPWWTEEGRYHCGEQLKLAMAPGSPKLEQFFAKKDSGNFWVESTCTPVIENNQTRFFLTHWVDITARKKAVEALQESEEMYRSLMKTSPDAVTVTDLDGNITDVSQRTLELHGFKNHEELLGKSAWELIAPEDHQNALDNLQKTIKTGIVRSLEYIMLKKDGSRFIGELNAAVIRDAAGKPRAFISTTRDITKRKQVEEELWAKDSAIASSINAFALSDTEGNITYVNPAFLRMWGYGSEKEILGRPAIQFWRLTEKASEFLRTLQEKGSWEGEITATRRNGTGFDAEVLASMVRGKSGNFIGVMASFVDITERKQVESERTRLATAVEQAGEGIIIITRDQKILYVNPAFERISGYLRQEISGRDFSMLESRKPGQTFSQEMWKIVQLGQIWTGQQINQRKDGSLCEVEVTISPIRDRAGVITSFVAVEQDITHEIRLERQLRQAQKMEAIGTLAGGIAHDFKNILGIIMGYTDMALLDTPGESPAKRNLEQVLKAGHRGKDLIKQITTFSRRSEQEKKTVRLTPIIEETLNFLRASLPTTIDIRQSFAAEVDTVFADPTQINQVLMNLCANSAHAMREKGGTLTVSLSEMTLGPENASSFPGIRPGPYLKMTVTDTGHGMGPEILDRIFDPYFTTKDPGEGTGMGLSVVHGIVQDHEGFVSVHSEAGKGSSFEIYLPRVHPELSSESELSRPVPTGRERILFVDDEEDLVDIARQMLTRLGYHVKATSNSTRALEIFRENPDGFDLVITDQTMPRMTGIELTREIKKLRSDIPVILCTGFSEAVDSKRLDILGIEKLIMKPVVTRDLAEAIRRVLDQKNKTESVMVDDGQYPDY
ncbi:MAG: PAS domain S-box protein [bacterium]|nr:PAS domain S-box protein [bacterium]